VLFHWLYPLSEHFAGFNVFRYITFRSAGAIVTAVLLSLLLGPKFIRALERWSIGQNIRDEGPERHHTKAGTPTMGGVLVLFAVVVATVLWVDLTNPLVWVAVGVTCFFGAIGFLDDWLKLRRRQNLGLRAATKFTLQMLVAAVGGGRPLVTARGVPGRLDGRPAVLQECGF